MTDLSTLFHLHIAERQRTTAEALAETGFDALVISSGRVYTHFADDQDAPFHPTPHFAHWCPLAGPHHALVLRPGQTPRLIRFAPEDFWYEQAPLGNPFWASEFTIEEVGTVEDVWKRLGTLGRAAYIGNETDRADTAGLEVNPALLTAHLDWHRTTKSAYEVQCIEEATVIAARGHQAARTAFLSGASELDIHHAYIQAAGIVDQDMPYGSIVALDEKGATLHYEGKRKVKHGKVLLIDAGAQVRGYAADITRTLAAPHCDARFAALIAGMERIELRLCELVRPNLPYGDLHHQGHLLIADLLRESGILRATPEEAVEKGLSRPFFPHGLGHHLGIQVHDVAGRQGAADGTPAPPPPQHPTLRTTRTIEAQQVFTVEPGLYFIPMLLRPFRENGHSTLFNWPLIDELTPCGGIRIEDNLLVTAAGHRNLTRPHLPI
ncbi:MAG: Xaa-Pro dipeptidase [Holophagaceae bacterium]|uniref:Xaa-Pro dipeptidase n=1 Tax=Candidatus Geothrix skivensis TaxID=2954439 RepID=A0A9D7XKM3_9BACT|nr:Xaa-Pro dipeptidase [Candidatus Geothrix skivensis]